jgi:hypothetical protein
MRVEDILPAKFTLNFSLNGPCLLHMQLRDLFVTAVYLFSCAIIRDLLKTSETRSTQLYLH